LKGNVKKIPETFRKATYCGGGERERERERERIL
jgi:hypothetical protein